MQISQPPAASMTLSYSAKVLCALQGANVGRSHFGPIKAHRCQPAFDGGFGHEFPFEALFWVELVDVVVERLHHFFGDEERRVILACRRFDARSQIDVIADGGVVHFTL